MGLIWLKLQSGGVEVFLYYLVVLSHGFSKMATLDVKWQVTITFITEQCGKLQYKYGTPQLRTEPQPLSLTIKITLT